LNNPDRQVVVGDTYGYNYNLFATTLEAFTQFKFTYNKVDFYLAQNFSSSMYQRELYKKRTLSDQFFWESEQVTFENFGFKAGLQLKISGKQLVTFNAAHLTKTSLRNTFANSRLNNSIVNDLERKPKQCRCQLHFRSQN
jgi:hypothetical protein